MADIISVGIADQRVAGSKKRGTSPR
jgi:hypothetical protein